MPCGKILASGLTSIGIEGDEAEIIWAQQLKKPKPLKTFLKGLDSSRKKHSRKQNSHTE